MGNADSHSSLVLEDVPSARGWWRSSQASCRRSSRHQHAKGSGPAADSGGGSPKVLFRDGGTRVEFTKRRISAAEPDGRTGTSAPAGDASLRASSSLGSDGSWYDSPWGAGPEPSGGGFGSRGYSILPPAETNEFTSTSSGRTDDSGIGDSMVLQPDPIGFGLFSSCAVSLDSVSSSHSPLPGFPTAPGFPAAPGSSSSPLPDDVIQEEEGSAGGAEQSCSSLTLPSRRPESVGAAGGIGRKDFLKSRIRRMSDWTGSLSRKKRRIQVGNGA